MRLVHFEIWIIFFGHIFWLLLTQGVDLKTPSGSCLAIGLCLLLFFNKKITFDLDRGRGFFAILWRILLCISLYKYGWQEVSWSQTGLVLLAAYSSLAYLNTNHDPSPISRYWLIPLVLIFEHFLFGSVFIFGLFCWIKPKNLKLTFERLSPPLTPIFVRDKLFSFLLGALIFLLLNESIWSTYPSDTAFLFIGVGSWLATLHPLRRKKNLIFAHSFIIIMLFLTIFSYSLSFNLFIRILTGICLGQLALYRCLSGAHLLFGFVLGYLIAQREEAEFLLWGLIFWAIWLSKRRLFEKQQS
jgi:hypothetical protein